MSVSKHEHIRNSKILAISSSIYFNSTIHHVHSTSLYYQHMSHNHSVPSLQYVTHPSSQCKVLVGLLNKAQINKLTLKHCFSRSIWAVFSELVLNTIFNKSTNFCNAAPLKRKGELLVTERYWITFVTKSISSGPFSYVICNTSYEDQINWDQVLLCW